MEQIKEIKITTEYITLGQFLKFISLIESGAKAKNFLIENKVLVNNEETTQRGKKLYEGYKISVNNLEFFEIVK